MVRRRNVHVGDPDDDDPPPAAPGLDEPGQPRSRGRTRGSAFAKRQQTPSPPPTTTADQGGSRRTRAGDVNTSPIVPGDASAAPPDYADDHVYNPEGGLDDPESGIPKEARDALKSSVERVRALEDGFMELGVLVMECLEEKPKGDMPDDVFRTIKALEGYRMITELWKEGARAGIHPSDVLSSVPPDLLREIGGTDPAVLLQTATAGMPAVWAFLLENYPEVIARSPTQAIVDSPAMNPKAATSSLEELVFPGLAELGIVGKTGPDAGRRTGGGMPPLPPELVGAKISVITTKEIRYEGILYEVRQDESSFRLHEVKSFGTEGRVKKGKKVPPGDVYKGYVDIKGSDIKDIKLIDVIDSEKGDEWPDLDDAMKMNKAAAKKKPGSKKQKDLHGRIQSATEALGKMTFADVMDEIKKSAEGGDGAVSKLDTGELDEHLFGDGDGDDDEYIEYGSEDDESDEDEDDDDYEWISPPADTPYRYRIGDSVLVAWDPASQDPPYDKGWRRAIVVGRHVPADGFDHAKLSPRGRELSMLAAMYTLRDAGIDPTAAGEDTRFPPMDAFVLPYVVKLTNDEGKEERVPIPRDDAMHIRGCWEETKKCGKKPAKKLRFRTNDQVEVWVGPGYDGNHAEYDPKQCWIQGTVREFWSFYPGWGRGWSNGRWIDGLRKDQIPYIVTPAGAEDEIHAHKAAGRVEELYPNPQMYQTATSRVLNDNTVLVLADTDEWIRIPKLRFRAGSRVECKIRDPDTCPNGGFAPGVVVGTYYREEKWRPGVCAPYQVKLDGEKKLIYAPVDDDTYIRAID